MPPMMTVAAVLHHQGGLGLARGERRRVGVAERPRWATALTSWRICRFTRPFEFTCGSTVRILPMSRYCTVFAVVGATALVCRKVEVEVRIGTDSPDQDVRLAVVRGDDVRRGQHLHAGACLLSALRKMLKFFRFVMTAKAPSRRGARGADRTPFSELPADVRRPGVGEDVGGRVARDDRTLQAARSANA